MGEKTEAELAKEAALREHQDNGGKSPTSGGSYVRQGEQLVPQPHPDDRQALTAFAPAEPTHEDNH